MYSNNFIYRNRNDGRGKHDKYEYIQPEFEQFSSDTVCNCSYGICKCDRDNPAVRLSEEGFGRMEDQLSDVQQEDYDSVYGLDSLPLLFGNNDIVSSQFDSNDDIEETREQKRNKQ